MAKKGDIQFLISFNDKGSATLKKVSRDTKKELDGMGKSTQKLGDQFKKTEKETEKTEKGMGKLKSALKSTWGQMAIGMGVTQLVASGIRKLTNTIKDTIKVGMEFQSAWANTTTMLQIGARETDAMRQELMHMSPVLGSSTELAKGLYQVLSASVEPAKALDVLAVSAMSAKAGLTDAFTAVDAITTVLNSYKMEAEEAENVSDIMFQTVKRGKTTYEQLAGSLGTVTPIASQVGIGFNEISGALATMTKQGINVNTATMQLRQVMVSVLKPSKEASELAKELGLDFSATALRAKGLSKFLQDVTKATKGDAEAMTMLFGNVRALTGVMSLAGSSAKSFETDLKAMSKASGSTQEAFQKQMQSTQFWVDTAKNTFNKLKISIFEGITQPFKDSIRTGKELEDALLILQTKFIFFGEKVGKVMKGLSVVVSSFAEVLKGDLSAGLDDTLAKIVGMETPSDKFNREMIEGRIEAMRWKEGLTGVTITMTELADKFADEKWRKEMEARSRAFEQYKKQAENVGKPMGVWTVLEWQLGEAQHQRATRLAQGYENYKAYMELMSGTAKSQNDVKLTGADLLKMMEELEIKGIIKTKAELNRLMTAYTELSNANKLTLGEKKKLASQIVSLANDLGVTLPTSIYLTAGAFTHLNEEVLPKANEGLKGIQETVLQFAFGLEEVPKTFDYVATGFDNFGRQIRASHQNIMDSAQDSLESYYFQPGKKGLEEYLKDFVDEHKNALIKVAEGFASIGNKIGGVWGDVFASIGVGLETFVSQISNTDKSISEILGSMSVAIGQIGGKIGEAISGVEDSFAGLGSSLGSAIGGIFGPLGSAIGSLAGGLLGGLFGSKKQKSQVEIEAEKVQMWTDAIIEKYAKWGEVSEQTAKIISEEVVKRGMLGFIAVSKHFAKVIEDVGITQSNVNDLWDRADDIMDHYSIGLIGADDATQALNDSFEQLLQGTRELGQEGSEAMIEFIKKAKRSGLELSSVTQYILEQLDRIPEALGTLIKNAVPGEKWLKKQGGAWEDYADRFEGRLEGMAKLAITSFNAMLASGRSWTESLKAMEEPIGDLIDKYKQMGLEIPDALKPMADMLDLMDKKPRLFENLDASITMLQALGNTAYLTQDTFDELVKSATQLAKAILGVDGNLNQAMRTMELSQTQINQILPMISKFVGMAGMFGITVPAWMKSFVTQQLDMDFSEFKQYAKEQANAGILSARHLDDIKSSNLDIKHKLGRQIDQLASINRGISDMARELSRSNRYHGEGAQMGFHGVVTGPETFHIESGRRERVDITPAGGSQEANSIKVNTTIRPVVVPLADQGGWLIDFIQEATEDERLTISDKSIRRSH